MGSTQKWQARIRTIQFTERARDKVSDNSPTPFGLFFLADGDPGYSVSFAGDLGEAKTHTRVVKVPGLGREEKGKTGNIPVFVTFIPKRDRDPGSYP